MSSALAAPRVFLIVSAGRSGTTWLADALAPHSRIALSDEARVFDFFAFVARWAALPDHERAQFEFEQPLELRGIATSRYAPLLGELVRERVPELVAEFYRRAFPDKRPLWIGDKLPHPSAARAARELFPGLRCVYLVRDPRDYLCSARSYAARADIRAAYPHLEVSARAHLEYWRNVHAAARAEGAGVLALRYEDLVAAPQALLVRVLAFLELEPELACAAALDARGSFARHATSASAAASVGRWRSELARAEVELADSICGPWLAELGYER